MDPDTPSPLARAWAWVPFVLSAALVATALHLGIRWPWLGVSLGLIALWIGLREIAARRRARELLVSGDVESVLVLWGRSLDGVPHPETIEPLVAATALAANGMIDRARGALARAERGPAWDATLEHRLFVETLLDAFEGDRERALEKAQALESLPLPTVGPFLRSRVAMLRGAAAALARSFAHVSGGKDVDLLLFVARRNPLVHWAMRYAAAIACVDAGERGRAQDLLAGAPAWPDGSAFQAFHEEIARASDGAEAG